MVASDRFEQWLRDNGFGGDFDRIRAARVDYVKTLAVSGYHQMETAELQRLLANNQARIAKIEAALASRNGSAP